MKTLKIIILIIVLLIIIGLGLLYLPKILSFFVKDIPSVDTTGLELSNRSILSSENAFFDLAKISPVIYRPSNINIISDFADGKAWDTKISNEIVLKNTDTLIFFSNASAKLKLQNPSYNDVSLISINNPLPKLNDWREASKISAIRSLLLAKQNKYNEAFNEALKSVKIGQLIIDSHVSLIEYLVGIAIKSIGLNTLETILPASNLSKAQYSKYSEDLNKIFDTGEGLKSAFIIEHYMRVPQFDVLTHADKETLSELPKDIQEKLKSKNNYYYEVNKTKQLDVEYTRQQIANIEIKCDEGAKIPLIKKIAPQSSILLFFTENAVGKILIDTMSDSLSTIYQKRCEKNTQLAKVINMFDVKSKTLTR